MHPLQQDVVKVDVKHLSTSFEQQETNGVTLSKQCFLSLSSLNNTGDFGTFQTGNSQPLTMETAAYYFPVVTVE